MSAMFPLKIAIFGVKKAKCRSLEDRKKYPSYFQFKPETYWSHTSVAPQFIAGLHSPLIIQAKTRLLPGKNNKNAKSAKKNSSLNSWKMQIIKGCEGLDAVRARASHWTARKAVGGDIIK